MASIVLIVARRRAHAQVIGADGHNIDEAMAWQHEDRLGIARAIRAGLLDRMDERRRRRACRHGAVDFEAGPGARLLDRRDKLFLEEGAKVAEPVPGERHPRRHRMAAPFDKNARLDGRAHDAAKIDAGDRAARTRRLQPVQKPGRKPAARSAP